MKKTVVLMIFIVVVAACSVTESRAQNLNFVVSEEKISSLLARVYEAPAENFLLKQLNETKEKGFRIVFLFNDKRFTFDHDWYADGIQVWVRPEGTFHPNPPDCCLTDYDLDGIVDSGIDEDIHVFAVANAYYDGSEARGLEFQEYWQKIYKEALTGLEATLH